MMMWMTNLVLLVRALLLLCVVLLRILLLRVLRLDRFLILLLRTFGGTLGLGLFWGAVRASLQSREEGLDRVKALLLLLLGVGGSGLSLFFSIRI